MTPNTEPILVTVANARINPAIEAPKIAKMPPPNAVTPAPTGPNKAAIPATPIIAAIPANVFSSRACIPSPKFVKRSFVFLPLTPNAPPNEVRAENPVKKPPMAAPTKLIPAVIFAWVPNLVNVATKPVPVNKAINFASASPSSRFIVSPKATIDSFTAL